MWCLSDAPIWRTSLRILQVCFKFYLGLLHNSVYYSRNSSYAASASLEVKFTQKVIKKLNILKQKIANAWQHSLVTDEE